jgi:hypothetical protein
MERFLERFLCCCVNTTGDSETVGMTGEMLGGANGEAAYPSQSTVPQFPTQDVHRPVKGVSNSLAVEDGNGTMGSARSQASLGSSMSAEEKEMEKARLQRLVKDFAKEAVTGIAVSLVNAETSRRSPHFFQMDR